MSNDNGGPAYPSSNKLRVGDLVSNGHTGMSLHDYFAAHADVSAYTPIETFERAKSRKPTIKELAEYIAEIRTVEADAMLKARQQ